MSLTQLINRPCTLLLRTDSAEHDAYNKPIRTETEVEAVCELQQRGRGQSGQEQDVAGEISQTNWALFLLPGIDVNAGDAVAVDGVTYEVQGEPWAVRDPFTDAVDHIEATLTLTAGPEQAGGTS